MKKLMGTDCEEMENEEEERKVIPEESTIIEDEESEEEECLSSKTKFYIIKQFDFNFIRTELEL